MNETESYKIEWDETTQKHLVYDAKGKKKVGFADIAKAQAWINGRAAKANEPKEPPPVTFPLPPEVWRQFILEGMERLYGAKLTDTVGRFQDDYLMMSGQPVVKK